MNHSGFTLLETLVALLILGLVLGALLQAQITALNAEQSARGLTMMSLEAGRIATSVRLNLEPTQILETACANPEVQLAAPTRPESQHDHDCLQWDLSASFRPTLRLSLITRQNDLMPGHEKERNK